LKELLKKRNDLLLAVNLQSTYIYYDGCIHSNFKYEWVEGVRFAELSEWVVGESRAPELPGVVTCRTRQALLDICSHPEPAVSLEALRLFEVMVVTKRKK
jgi:hypothetical protein